MTEYTTLTAEAGGSAHCAKQRPLRIVIPGGGGHLGRILTHYFVRAGHSVTTLTRSAAEESPKVLTDGPAKRRSLQWDGRNLDRWVTTLENADVLINLAGRTVDCRYNAKNRDEILRSRVESTAVLGRAIGQLKNPPRVWLNASTATIYRHTFDRDMDEFGGEIGGKEDDAPLSWRFSTDVAREWEEAFFRPHTPRTRKVAMRAAMVMSTEPGGVFEMVLRLVRMGLGGAWGSGRQYMSWIHEKDFVRAIEFLIQREEISGVANLAAPEPLPNAKFLAELRGAWGIPFGLPAREWMLAVGAWAMRTETELLLKSRRVVAGVLQRHGFVFDFPHWAEAAQDLVDRWAAKREFVGKGRGGAL